MPRKSSFYKIPTGASDEIRRMIESANAKLAANSPAYDALVESSGDTPDISGMHYEDRKKQLGKGL